MTDEQRAKKIAQLAWEIQPRFRARFKTEEELAERILAGSKSSGGMFGFFLPVCVLETLCSVETFKDTLAHAELDAVTGESTVSPDEVATAREVLEHIGPVMPTFESYCGDWVDGK